MKLFALVSVLGAVFLLTERHPFLAGLVAMIPVKILAALWFRGSDLLPVVDGLLLGSVATSVGLFGLWLWLR